jgi:hypothetical protein
MADADVAVNIKVPVHENSGLDGAALGVFIGMQYVDRTERLYW